MPPTNAHEATETTAETTTAFLITKEYRRFEEFCNACRRDRYIGVCYGMPGVGKTLSARYYTRWDVLKDTDPFDFNTPVPPEIAECRTLFYTPDVTNSPRQIKDHLETGKVLLRGVAGRAERDLDTRASSPGFHETCELIIVDEADRLKMPSLEQLRDMYDREHFGLVLVGMPGLEKRLARYPQLYSRIGFAHTFRPLSNAEMLFVLEHHWKKIGSTLHPDDFTDQEAVATVIRVTAGNFRLLQRLFSQIERILKLNDLKTITKEVVETARDCLVIGTN
jgi:DNA transposition AAA+ family ATPase